MVPDWKSFYKHLYIIDQRLCAHIKYVLINIVFNIYEVFNQYLFYFYYAVPNKAPRNVNVTVLSSQSIMLSWERPSLANENGLLICYHAIVIETQIHYLSNGTEIIGMETYLNQTYNISEARTQLIDRLHPDYNYTVRIAAATGPGIGPFSDAITVRTDMDGKCSAYT